MEQSPTHDLRAVPRARISAALGAALYLAVYATLYAAVPNDHLRAVLTTLFMLVAVGLGLGSSMWAVANVPHQARTRWIAITVSTASFFVGMAYRTIYVLQTDRYPPAGSLEDFAFILGFLAMIPAVILMTQPRQGVRLTTVRQALDLAGIALAILAGLALLVLIPARVVGGDMGLTGSISFAVYTSVSTALIVYVLAFKHTPWTSAETLILTGLATGSLATLSIAPALESYTPTLMWTGVPNSLITATFLFFGLAGVHAATRQSAFGGLASTVLVPRWTQHASTLIALVGVPWLIIASSQAGPSFTRSFLTTVAVVLAVTVAGRNIIMNIENRQLSERAIHDPLTGLYNAKHYHAQVRETLAGSERDDTDTCLCTIIVDGLDDRVRLEGFTAGDALTKSIARRIESVVGLDVTYRTGSDRFALLLSSTNAVEAYDLCASIMRAAESTTSDEPIALSIGIASARLTTTDPEVLISYAAGAAYWASSTGGNRVVLFDPEVVTATNSRSHIADIEEQSHTRLLEALAAAVDARDPYTRHHSANVAQLVEAFAQHLELPADRRALMNNAALMHDLGKIGIPDSVLLKPGKLNDEEYDAIRTHSELGARILSSGSSSEIIPWVRSHHERWDGQGYPDGLSSNDIPYEARILTICDAWDAMTSDRPYRQGLSVSLATEEIMRCSGTQFDPNLVEPFLEALFKMWPQTGGSAFRVTRGPDGHERETVLGHKPAL